MPVLHSPTMNFIFKTTAEMSQVLNDLPQALDNTNEIVDKVEHLKLKQDIMLPNFVIPQEFCMTKMIICTTLPMKGAKERYKDITPDVRRTPQF